MVSVIEGFHCIYIVVYHAIYLYILIFALKVSSEYFDKWHHLTCVRIAAYPGLESFTLIQSYYHLVYDLGYWNDY